MKIPHLHIQTGHWLYALELVFQSREQVTCNLVIAQKKKNALVIKNQYSEITFEESVRLLKGKTHVIVSITGKGVLLKRISSFSTNATEIIRQAVPNAQAHDFYVQCISVENQAFSGIIRSEWVEPWIQRYSQEKILFSNVLIGPYAAAILKQVLYPTQLAFQVGRYKFIYEDNKLKEVSASENSREETLRLENTVIEPGSIIGFCSLLALETGFILCSEIESGVLHEMRKEKKQQKRFHSSLAGSVGALFFVLMANLIINNHYRKQYSVFHNQVSYNQAKLDKIAILGHEIKHKRELMGDNISHGPVLSLMADELASSVPSSIKLTELNVFPVQGKIRHGEIILYEKNKIKVSGFSQRSQDLNKWIKDIRQLNWVVDISILNYTYPQPANEGQFQLLILVAS